MNTDQDASQLSAEARIMLKLNLVHRDIERKTKALEEIAKTECLVLTYGDHYFYCPHCIATKALANTELVKTQYSLVRCGGALSHGSSDARKTSCGIDIDDKWIITHNHFDGEINCSKCLKKIKNNT